MEEGRGGGKSKLNRLALSSETAASNVFLKDLPGPKELTSESYYSFKELIPII